MKESYYFRRRRLTTAIAAMPPAKSDIETGSGTFTAGPAKAGAATMAVAAAIVTVARRFFMFHP